ncbi:uncharacterized protein [Periplaneta americana]|uniref:uncharacterized protein n=1 Tax=Periplaneta americana TaxID=6978 RepID=UPI0037E78ADE
MYHREIETLQTFIKVINREILQLEGRAMILKNMARMKCVSEDELMQILADLLAEVCEETEFMEGHNFLNHTMYVIEERFYELMETINNLLYMEAKEKIFKNLSRQD